VRPLHGAATQAARHDTKLGERLALVDALRLGDARIRGVAAELLTDHLEQLAACSSDAGARFKVSGEAAR
jgi:hypothetical protein